MSILTGRKMAINNVGKLYEFGLQHISDAEGTVDSSTQGGTDRACGNSDWRGYYVAYGYLPLLFPNDTFDFKGAIDDDSDNGTICAYATARCTKIEINFPVGLPGGYIWHRAEFGNDDEDGLQFSGATITDAHTGERECAHGLYLTLGSTAQANVEWMKLVISQNAEPTVDSSSPSVYRREKGDIDWALSWQRKFGAFSDLPTLHAVYAIKVYCGTSSYWGLNYGRITQSPIFQHNRQRDRRPLVGVCVAEMCAWNGTDFGSITPPGGGAAKWPEAEEE